MSVLQLNSSTGLSFGASGSLVNASQAVDDAVFIIDLRPTTPVIIVEDNLDYVPLGWDINDVAAVVTLVGPQGEIYANVDYNDPDIVPATSRLLNRIITLPLDPLTNYTNILQGNYTLKISWYNSVLDEYEAFLKTYQFDLTLPEITNTTTSGPYTGILTSTDTTDYGNDVYQTTRVHRVKYPTQLSVVPADVVSSNAEIIITPIYTNQWNIEISSFIEYRKSDTLRIYWEGEGAFTHCVYGGCISAMHDAINTMFDTYYYEMACNIGNQEAWQKRLVIVNTSWHLLNDAYWNGDTEDADKHSYIIQEQVEYTGDGVCGGVTSVEVVPCPAYDAGAAGDYTFDNGLTLAATNLQWGGTLVENTDIVQVGYVTKFSGAYAGDTFSHEMSAAGGVIQKASDGATEGQMAVENDNVTIGVSDLATPANSRLYQFGTAGLVEVASYIAGYGLRSLVSKEYVDTAVAAVIVPTFSDGLVLALENVTFDINTITGGMPTVADDDLLALYDDDAGANISLPVTYIRDYIYSEALLTVSATSIVYAGTDGIAYSGDISATFTDHSLITKKWVEDNFSAGAGTFLALSDTFSAYATFAGYFLQVNGTEDGIDFVTGSWIPVTGGTFTGPITIATINNTPLTLQQLGAGTTPGTPEAGENYISFLDNDGDQQGYAGINSAGTFFIQSNVGSGAIQLNNPTYVNGSMNIPAGSLYNINGSQHEHAWEDITSGTRPDLALTFLTDYTRGALIVGGVADWEALTIGTANYILKSDGTDVAWGQVDYSELIGTLVVPNDDKSSAVDAGETGEIAWGDDYIYICTAAGLAGSATWKKAVLTQAP